MSNILSDKIQIGWISGMPRSGTTWLAQIFASSPDVRLKYCPLFSYKFKNALDESSTSEQWINLLTKVYQTNSEFLDQDHLRKHGLVPFFEEKHKHPQHLIIKSNRFHNLTPHIMKSNDQIRFIHIVRHPCATIHSWLTNTSEFPSHADPMKEWRMGKCRKMGPGEYWGFDDWKKVTLEALRLSKQYPDRYKIIRYENLVKNTESLTRELFDFFQLPYENQSDEFIKLSHSRHDDHKHSVFKDPNLKDKWEKMLDPTIISACLDEIRGTELEYFTKQ
tara:strand:- start:25260 stop:26090 length:831 start_codon:yes stop_codon:yes gene_type:complete